MSNLDAGLFSGYDAFITTVEFLYLKLCADTRAKQQLEKVDLDKVSTALIDLLCPCFRTTEWPSIYVGPALVDLCYEDFASVMLQALDMELSAEGAGMDLLCNGMRFDPRMVRVFNHIRQCADDEAKADESELLWKMMGWGSESASNTTSSSTRASGPSGGDALPEETTDHDESADASGEEHTSEAGPTYAQRSAAFITVEKAQGAAARRRKSRQIAKAAAADLASNQSFFRSVVSAKPFFPARRESERPSGIGVNGAEEISGLEGTASNRSVPSRSTISPQESQVASKGGRKLFNRKMPASQPMQLATVAYQTGDEVLQAMIRNPHALELAPSSLRGNREVALLAVKQNGLALEHVGEDLKADREIVLSALRFDGLLIKHAHESLRADPEIAAAAMVRTSSAAQYVSKDLLRDHQFAASVLAKNGDALQHFDESVRADKDTVRSAMRHRVDSFLHAAAELRLDTSFVLEQVHSRPEVLMFLDDSVLRDHSVVVPVLKILELRGFPDSHVARAAREQAAVSCKLAAFIVLQNWSLRDSLRGYLYKYVVEHAGVTDPRYVCILAPALLQPAYSEVAAAAVLSIAARLNPHCLETGYSTLVNVLCSAVLARAFRVRLAAIVALSRVVADGDTVSIPIVVQALLKCAHDMHLRIQAAKGCRTSFQVRSEAIQLLQNLSPAADLSELDAEEPAFAAVLDGVKEERTIHVCRNREGFTQAGFAELFGESFRQILCTACGRSYKLPKSWKEPHLLQTNFGSGKKTCNVELFLSFKEATARDWPMCSECFPPDDAMAQQELISC